VHSAAPHERPRAPHHLAYGPADAGPHGYILPDSGAVGTAYASAHPGAHR
jgi:hypothetical protein